MLYFDRFPVVEYGGDPLVDITRRVYASNDLKENPYHFTLYEVKDGETPESVAYDHYGDANLHWVILIFNDIIDPLHDWVMDHNTLIRYVEAKYGQSGVNQIHHYVDSDGKSVPSDWPGAIPVTNMEYEIGLNDERRRIRLLLPELIDRAVDEFEALFA